MTLYTLPIFKQRDSFNHNFQIFEEKFLNKQLIVNYPSVLGPVHLYLCNLIEKSNLFYEHMTEIHLINLFDLFTFFKSKRPFYNSLLDFIIRLTHKIILKGLTELIPIISKDYFMLMFLTL